MEISESEGKGKIVLCLSTPASRPFRKTGGTLPVPERRIRPPLGIWLQVNALRLLLVRGRVAFLHSVPRRGHPGGFLRPPTAQETAARGRRPAIVRPHP